MPERYPPTDCLGDGDAALDGGCRQLACLSRLWPAGADSPERGLPVPTLAAVTSPTTCCIAHAPARAHFRHMAEELAALICRNCELVSMARITCDATRDAIRTARVVMRMLDANR